MELVSVYRCGIYARRLCNTNLYIYLTLLLCLSITDLPAQDDASVAGDWIFHMVGDPTPQRVALTAEGDSVSGRVYGYPFKGVIDGSDLTFRVGNYFWSGTLEGDKLGGWIINGPDTSAWSGKRFRLPASPRSFDLKPTNFSRLVSADLEPALKIFPGDTVRTSTVDAAGWSTGGYRENKED